MSWMQKLYEAYENCKTEVGIMPQNGSIPLLPVAHTTKNAHIEITIDENGNFKKANVIDKNDATTIIPCTEDSESRANKEAPHPLCDKLQYVAADYEKFVGNDRYFHQSYLDLLTGWCNSANRHWKAEAVLKYVKKGSMIKDLVDKKILHIDNEGLLINKWNTREMGSKPLIFGVLQNQSEAFIRWRVMKQDEPDSTVWADKSLFESWYNYYNTLESQRILCYVSGEIAPYARIHPKYIRYSTDGAKLISSNDNTNFTYRGRFTTPNEACAVSYDVTQKAHKALKWLISKQGYRNDSQVIVAWATSGAEIPKPTDDSFELCGFDEADTAENEGSSPAYTAEQFGRKLSQRIAGYSAKLGSTNSIVVMGLDSASSGRLSVKFYRELTGSDFLNRIENWHNSCCWIHNYKTVTDSSNTNNRKRVNFYGAPSPRDIVEAAYGTNVADNLRKATIERLLPCIVDGRPIPYDIVESAVRRASNRAGMNYWEFNKKLSIACALYKKFREKEEYSVALETDRSSRDYLYGRLLALADRLERCALNDIGEKRMTNAERLMQRFADHPCSTWRTIELSLAPHKARLGGRSIKYQKIQQEIMDLFKTEDFISDKKLSGEFLLGYHCQLSALYKDDPTTNNSDQNGK